MFKKLLVILPMSFTLLSMAPNIKPAAKTYDGKAFDSKQQIDLSDLTDSQVATYYSNVDTTLNGTNFINSLYSTINDSSTINYVTYGDGVKKWYKITDRNWDLSRAITPETYKFDDDTGDNYFLTLMYYEDNSTKSKAINTDVNGYKNDATTKAVDFTNKTRPSTFFQVDKEHVWAKSHGFPQEKVTTTKTDESGNTTTTTKDKDPEQGAGTDLHHLIAADHNTNSAGHNDLYYGNVDKTQSYTTIYCYYADGTTDISGWKGKDKDGDEAFEPTDQWKGNVARALLYMGTMYSNKLTQNTRAQPYLLLTDDKTQTDDVENFHGVHHNLSTLLEWNEKDPVDDYEKHRNNLIYSNVQRNRNPYVDHPEWARKAYDPNYTEDPSQPTDPSSPSTSSSSSSPTSSSATSDPISSSSSPDSSTSSSIDSSSSGSSISSSTSSSSSSSSSQDTKEDKSNFSNLKKSYSVHIDSSLSISVEFSKDTTIEVEFDSSILEIFSDKKTVKALKECTSGTTLTYKETTKSGAVNTYSTKIYVYGEVALTKQQSNLKIAPIFGSQKVDLTADNLVDGEYLYLESSDEEIVHIEGYDTLVANGNGKATITIRSSLNPNKALQTFDVEVSFQTLLEPPYLWYLIIALVALSLVIILSIILGVRSGAKKKKRKSQGQTYSTRKKSSSKKSKPSGNRPPKR